MKKITQIKEIIFKEDRYHMNWLREDFSYAAVKGPKELDYQVYHKKQGDCIHTEILFNNRQGKPVFTHTGSISVSFPLQDKYESSEVCMKYRCHTHIFCGEDVSYVMALRMGGDAPHLGMVVEEGSLSSYSVTRNVASRSNDRGCFWLHPSAMQFAPGETKRLSWVVFPHKGKIDFYEQMGKYRQYVKVEADHYVLFPDEKVNIRIMPSFEAEHVWVDGAEIMAKDGQYHVEYSSRIPREKILHICVDGIRTICRLLVQEEPYKLAAARCRFIAEHQQYYGELRQLDGAYLAYDNEEKLQVYRPVNDYNGGRERVGMGLLLSEYLQDGSEIAEDLEKSLQSYIRFVERELADPETGEVFNDVGRDGSYTRQYNLPWYATFFTELYRQYHEKRYLVTAYRILLRFYKEGGTKFYPIDLPVLLIDEALKAAGMENERIELGVWFRAHADQLVKTGRDYPPSEVNYEQSIVAPAADVLLKVYCLSGEGKYLRAAREQMEVLDLFNGTQPDYHLYENAVRHWDGYWFGKRELYGDTFPHYWSALTGNVFLLYAQITGDAFYEKRAEDSLRGVLPLIFPDGSASCAYVFPQSVNGISGAYYDPYANDQDWGLYFYLRNRKQRGGQKNGENA